jgi:hypothetical protein
MPDAVGWRSGGGCFHECVFDELQLDLEIASSGVPTKVRPHEPLLQPGRRCVETSDDAIEDYFISTPDSRIWDLSPMRLGAAKTARESAKSPADITLVSKVARMLAAMKAMTGLLYVAVLIARLAGLYSTPKSS